MVALLKYARLYEQHAGSRKSSPFRGLAIFLCLVLAVSAAARAGDATVRPASIRPPDQAAPASLIPSTLIELDGSVSSSPDGSELSYRWRQVSGPKVELSDYSSPKPYFRTAQPGVYEFELVVAANGLDSEPHLVRLEIERENLPPVVKLPEEVWGQVGKVLEIDASESFDPEGEKLTYRWRPLSRGLAIPPAALSQPVLAFEPGVDGVFEVELIISDGEKTSAPVICRLNIKPKPLPPVAKVRINTLESPPAQPPQELSAMSPPAMRPVARIEGPVVANTDDMVMLDGRPSQGHSGQRLNYLWRQKSGAFINDFELVFDGSVERFKAPRPGDYEFELVVVDDDVESLPVTHRIKIVKDPDPPVAVVVAPSRAMPGDLIKMDATQSYDMAGNALIYRWRQTGGPAVKNYVIDEVLGDSAPAFHPPSPGVYSFELIVASGKLQSKPIEIDIEVGNARRPPALSVHGPEVANAGDRLVLEGAAENLDGRGVAFAWKQLEGPALALGQSNGLRAAVSPPVPGRYVFEMAAVENGQVVAAARRTLEVFNSPAGAARNGGANARAAAVQPLPQLPSNPNSPALVVPPAPVGTSQTDTGQAGRRVPELAPLNTSNPKTPSRSNTTGSSDGRAAAQVMTGGRYSGQ